MPITPFHIGPSGFLGLIFRKYIDLPVFVLANVVVDLEVLYWGHWPFHRYVHTFLIGGAIGILWGLLAYPLRNIFAKLMQSIFLPYKTSLLKMIFSGVTGIWLHIIIDAPYNWDVNLFWPSRIQPFHGLVTKSQMKIICLVFWAAAIVTYLYVVKRSKQKGQPKSNSDLKT